MSRIISSSRVKVSIRPEVTKGLVCCGRNSRTEDVFSTGGTLLGKVIFENMAYSVRCYRKVDMDVERYKAAILRLLLTLVNAIIAKTYGKIVDLSHDLVALSEMKATANVICEAISLGFTEIHFIFSEVGRLAYVRERSTCHLVPRATLFSIPNKFYSDLVIRQWSLTDLSKLIEGYGTVFEEVLNYHRTSKDLYDVNHVQASLEYVRLLILEQVVGYIKTVVGSFDTNVELVMLPAKGILVNDLSGFKPSGFLGLPYFDADVDRLKVDNVKFQGIWRSKYNSIDLPMLYLLFRDLPKADDEYNTNLQLEIGKRLSSNRVGVISDSTSMICSGGTRFDLIFNKILG